MQYLYWLYCVYDIKKQINLDVFVYLKQVIIPSVIILVSLMLLGCIIQNIGKTESLINFIITSTILIFVGILISYMLMTNGERMFIKNFVNKILPK